MHRLSWLVLAAAVLAACVIPGGGKAALASPAPRAHAASVAPSPAHYFDKTRFLLHTGIAFYAFHHWVINVYRARGFNRGASHRIGNIAKAGIATVFAYHELKVAYDIARKSNSKTLHLLIAPLNGLISVANNAGNHLRRGDYNPTDVTGLSSSVGSFGGLASRGGYAIKDVPFKVPGL